MKSDSFLEHRPLDELNMSPGSLAKRASNINPVVGIEYEMIMRVPDNRSIKDLTLDFYNDPRVDDIRSIEDFFSASVDAGITSERELGSAINGLEYDYREYQRQQELHGHDAFSEGDWLYYDRQLKRMSDVYYYVSGFVWPYYQKIMALHREGEYLADTLKPYFPNYNVVSHIDKPAHIDMNYNDFTIVYDYSINPTGIDAKDRPLELVGPKVTLDELHTQYRKIVKWCKQLGNYTNNSCGLHMNVSIPNKSMDSVDYAKLVLLLGDQKVLQDFDRLFQKNVTNYCASSQYEVFRFARNRPNEVMQTLRDMRKDMNSAASRAFYSMNLIKNVSVNLRRDRIEFRGPGGDWLNIPEEQIFSTLDRFVVALSAAMNPEAAKQEYAKKLYSLLMKSNPNLAGEDDHIKYFVQYATNEIKSPQELKNLLRRDMPRKRKETSAQRPSAIQQGIKALDQSDDLVYEEENEEGKPVRIRLSKSDDEDTPAKKFIRELRSGPNRVNPIDRSMTFITSTTAGFSQAELRPVAGNPTRIHISFFQAYPQKAGIGTEGMKALQRMAAEHGISLELSVWTKGKVKPSVLKKFYKNMGFEGVSGGMLVWTPPGASKTTPDVENVDEARKKQKQDKYGDCFEVAGQNMINYQPFSDKGMKLVHAFVSGQGPLAGVRYEHAWNELGDEVIDNSNGRNIRMPKIVYYAIGNIDPNNPEEYRMYDMAGLRKMATKFKHWGPWELSATSKSLYENTDIKSMQDELEKLISQAQENHIKYKRGELALVNGIIPGPWREIRELQAKIRAVKKEAKRTSNTQGGPKQESELDEYKDPYTMKTLRDMAKKAGYRQVGKGIDSHVFAKKDSSDVVKLLVGEPKRNSDEAALGFLKFYRFCKRNPNNPHLPKFGELKTIKIGDEKVYHITMERLYNLTRDEDEVAWKMLRFAGDQPFEKVIKEIRRHGTVLPDHSPEVADRVTKRAAREEKIAIANQSVFKLLTRLEYHAARNSDDIKIDYGAGSNILKRKDGTWVIVDPYVG